MYLKWRGIWDNQNKTKKISLKIVFASYWTFYKKEESKLQKDKNQQSK